MHNPKGQLNTTKLTLSKSDALLAGKGMNDIAAKTADWLATTGTRL